MVTLSPGTSRACLVCLRRHSPERGRGPLSLLGQPSLSVRLDLQKRDVLLHITDDLQDLVHLAGSCFWRLLPPYTGGELLDFFVLLSFSIGTGFQSRVPFPLLPHFGVCRSGLFVSPYHLGNPRPTREHPGKGEGKDVLVPLCWKARWGSLALGGITAASWVTPGGVSWVLVSVEFRSILLNGDIISHFIVVR